MGRKLPCQRLHIADDAKLILIGLCLGAAQSFLFFYSLYFILNYVVSVVTSCEDGLQKHQRRRPQAQLVLSVESVREVEKEKKRVVLSFPPFARFVAAHGHAKKAPCTTVGFRHVTFHKSACSPLTCLLLPRGTLLSHRTGIF